MENNQQQRNWGQVLKCHRFLNIYDVAQFLSLRVPLRAGRGSLSYGTRWPQPSAIRAGFRHDNSGVKFNGR